MDTRKSCFQITDVVILDQTINYIHENPVIARMVNESIHYPYSSAMDYSDGRALIHIGRLQVATKQTRSCKLRVAQCLSHPINFLSPVNQQQTFQWNPSFKVCIIKKEIHVA